MSSWRKRATACKSNGNAMSALDRPGRKSSVAIVVMCSIGFMSNSNPALRLTLYTNFSQLELTEPKSAKIEYTYRLRGLWPYHLSHYTRWRSVITRMVDKSIHSNGVVKHIRTTYTYIYKQHLSLTASALPYILLPDNITQWNNTVITSYSAK